MEDVYHRVTREAFYICYTEIEAMPLEQRIQRVRDTAERYFLQPEEIEKIHKEVRTKLKINNT